MKSRQSNMELLRIIAILMITMHHTIIEKYKGSIVYGNVFDDGWQIATVANSFVYIGVNLFVLISGYWGIKFKWKGVLNLFIFCAFYMFINCLMDTYVFHRESFSFGTIILKSLTSMTQTSKWFILAYTALYFLSPVLNSAMEQMSKTNYRRAIIILSVYCLYFGFIRNVDIFNNTGYSVGHFIWLYLIAGYIRKYITANKIKQHKNKLYCVFIGSSLIWAFLTIVNYTWIHIPTWRPTTYNNPFIMSASISFFCLFTTLDFHNKYINIIAKSSLAVYLFNLPVFKCLPEEFLGQLFGITYIGVAVVWTVVRFCVSVTLDQIRKLCIIPVDRIWNQATVKQR